MQSPVNSTIEIQPAHSLADFMFLRALRNRVRLNMTNDTAPITCLQQLRFFRRTPPNIQIFIARVDKKRAGYILLRHQAGRTFITEAVKDEFRSKGVAASMVRHAQRLWPYLTAEIFTGNIPSIKLHQATGFVQESEKSGIAVFRFSRPRQNYDARSATIRGS